MRSISARSNSRRQYASSNHLDTPGRSVFVLCLWLVLLSAGNAFAQTSSIGLTSPKSYPTGSTSIFVAINDLNGDGKPDLVVANQGSNTVSVLLNDGHGNFGSKIDFSTAAAPGAIAIADFNGDGKPDLAVACDHSMSLLLGDGTGSFGPKHDFAVGTVYTAIAAGDLNGDGKPDVAVTNYEASIVSVLYGDGAGGFAPKVDLPVGGAPISVALGDVNGDGALDIVTANFGAGTISVLINNGAGGFATALAYDVGPLPISLHLADLNGDGLLDVALANRDARTVAVALGIGTGRFGPPTYQPIGNSCYAIAIGDLNSDGKPDIAAANAGDGTLSMLEGIGDGSFRSKIDFSAGGGPYGMDIGDLKGDGTSAVVVANYSFVSVLFPTGKPELLSVQDVPNDQGGRVKLSWNASEFDLTSHVPIASYLILRAVPPNQAARAIAKGAPVVTDGAGYPNVSTGTLLVRTQQGTNYYWEYVASQPAFHSPTYSFVAQTTADSVAGSNPFTAFMIQATTDGAWWWFSNADSGYSVDNLAPPTPAPFVGVYASGTTALHWGSSSAADFGEFRLYRGLSPDFVPGPSNLVVASQDTGYVDSGATGYSYKLAAVDIHGNVSHYAVVTPNGTVATLAVLVALETQPNLVRLSWYAPGGPGLAATVYRRTTSSDWVPLDRISADGSGYLRYEDATVQAGTRYGYRLGIMDGGVEVFAGEAWAVTEPLGFALDGARPNPAVAGQLTVSFSLSSAQKAELELVDVSGRLVAVREVGYLGPGTHSVHLGEVRRTQPGVYLIRLTQDRRSITRRTVLLP